MRLTASLKHALAAAAAVALCLTAGWGQEDDLAKELPRIPAHEPADAPGTFKLHAGFSLKQAAVEPVVHSPVAVCYDADGRLYVVEMRGYPFAEPVPTGGISLLEDADGDGTFEKRHEFLKELSWPTGIVPYDGGVFITSVPDIIYAKDTDGDGKADIRRVVFTGFDNKNVQGLLNGLLWGNDGWIYGAAGTNGGDIVNPSQPGVKPVSVRGRDFRFKPDGSAFEAISGGGQFGHAVDDWGHRFVCSNSNHIRQVVLPARDLERNPALTATTVTTDIAVEGGAGPVFRLSPPEPWRVVRTRQRVADPKFVAKASPSELYAAGFFTSATGVTIYRGSAYAPEYRNNAFVGDVGGNLVHRKILSKNGAILQAKRADEGVEFLASTDNWFRPVNFANTPYGTLMILDMYRETIEHPISIPEPIKKHLDLTSGRDRGRLYELLPDGFKRRAKPALNQASTTELVQHLADPDAWWRDTAQRLLIEHGDKAAIAPLKDLARSRPNALARAHALWTLSVLGGLDDDLIVTALADTEPGVREQAAKLAGTRANSSASVREALLGLATDPDATVRFQVALALGDVADAGAAKALALIAAEDASDRWTRTAVLSSIGGRTRGLIEALAAKPGFFESPQGRDWLGELAMLTGTENRPDDVRAFLDRFAGGQSDPGLARVAVLGLGRGLQRSGGSLRDVLSGPAAEKIAPLFAKAAQVATGEGAPAARVDAIGLLALGSADDALKVLPDLLDARQPGPVQVAAIQSLAAHPDPRVGPAIVAHWKAMGPAVRREAAEALFTRRERLAALLDGIEAKTIAAAELDPARRKGLLVIPDRAIRARAETLLSQEARPDRGAVIAQYRKALELTGDPAKGKGVFTKVCATCHRAEGAGAQVGPDLATVTGRSPEDLLIHILDPNREIAPNYLNYVVITVDGRSLSGLIAEETAGAVTLKRAEGATDVVTRKQIEEIASTGLSLMPEGLEQGLDPQAVADLISYLRSIQGNSGPGPGPAPAGTSAK